MLSVIRLIPSYRLYKIDEVEEYNRSNPYIRTGYRGNLDWTDCLKSIFAFHNETLNIWTHLFGFFIFVGLFVREILFPDPNVHFGDWMILVGIIVSYQATMILSALFHVFSCHSKSVSQNCLSLDLLGISLCLLSTYLSGIYYAFYCDLFWRNFYLTTVGGIFIIASAAQLWPKITQDEYAFYRIGLFTLWALYGFLPTIHWAYLKGINDMMVYALLPRIFLMYGICGLALFFYVSKMPERCLPPGIVDIIGHSHQWWHAFIFLALLFWHNTGFNFRILRNKNGCSSVQNEDLSLLEIWPFHHHLS
nr:progestin and adipoQ receptor family member 3-like [Lepeophtheirus salmonis]